MKLFKKDYIDFLYSDFCIVLILFILAAIVRLVFLDSIPPGIHGDEGWTGLDAKRILEEGWIGPYTDGGLGQPTGPLYFTALIFKLFGESIFTLRFSIAFWAILTIPLFYIFLRQSFSKTVSLLASIALCFSLFHLHYSRIAFMLITAPFFQILTYIFLFKWRKNKKLYYLILTAIAMGLGMYTYNSFVIFPLTIFGFLLYLLIRSKFKLRLLGKISVFTILFIITWSPLLRIIITEPDYYFSHYNGFSEIKNLEPLGFSILEQVETIILKGLPELANFFIGHSLDAADSFGKWSTFNYSFLLLAVIGIIYAVWRRTEKALFLIFSMPIFLSPIFLTVDGTYRRSILVLIPLFYLVALGINSIVKIFSKYKIYILLGFVILVIFESFLNLHLYFFRFSQDLDSKRWFTNNLTQNALALSKIFESDSKILFFSEQWSCHYETSRFLFNTKNCEDRSHEFGIFSLEYSQPKTIFVLMDKYQQNFLLIYEKYPNGIRYDVKDKNNEVVGVIYKLP